MSNPMIRIHDLATDEIIDREMTDDEFETYKKDELARKAAAKKEQEEKAKLEKAKNALLEKLGITEEEAKLLLS